MKEDFIKRLINAEGNKRVTICVDDYAENPRYMTDEPLHCEDWSRDYSIMNKHETKSENARNLIRYLLQRYGNSKKIINVLKDNYKGSEHDRYENGLSYDRSRREWIVWSWQPTWKDYQGNVYEAHWEEEWAFCTNIYDVDIYNIADILSDEQIDTLCDPKYWTDGIKIMSYGFGYYGGISFYHEFSTTSEGICWLERDEFLKYSGCKEEERWQGKTLRDIEWLLDEIEAWSEGRAYEYYVEQANTFKVTKECLNDASKSKEYEETEWELIDSCGGFYGDIDNVVDYACEEADLNKEELKETEE